MSKLFTRLLGSAAVASIVIATPAVAAVVNGNLGVSATVTSNCTLATSPVAFGNVDVTTGLDVDSSGSIDVTCTSGVAWSASADAGAGTGATLDSRKMASGVNLLNYVLYTDEARTTVWGDGVGGATALISDNGTGVAQTKTIYGRVPGGQNGLPTGEYADTVAVTVTY